MTRRASKNPGLVHDIQRGLQDLATFTERCTGIRLRSYQLEAGQAILDAIRMQRGDSIVVMMSRQAGKDELCANLKAYLLARFMNHEVGIVEVNPTYKPQTINAIDRLDRRLQANPVTQLYWRKRSDFMRVFGKARVSFLSGDAHANVVGATASLLLIVNEAQDIRAATYDHKFAPMAASTNATRVFMGTAWRSDTLLARELRSALSKEQEDGRRRVFRYDADEVRAVLPSYGAFVDGEIRRLGRTHPLVKTQYFNEEIDAAGGMFDERRRALIFANGEPGSTPTNRPAAALFAFCIDVGGMDERAGLNVADLENSARDSTTLSIVQIELPLHAAEPGPTYRVVQRRQWTGADHVTVFGQIKALAERWQPRHFVVDATGVGEGLWAMLLRAFSTRVTPVKFNAATKSEIGYRFLAIIETGRFRDSSAGSAEGIDPQAAEQQYAACRAEVLTGVQRTMRWGVPDGTRGPNGELVHDDIVMADALVAKLDEFQWRISLEPCIIHAKDPLDDMSHIRAPRLD